MNDTTKTIRFSNGERATYDPDGILPISWDVYRNGIAELWFKTRGELFAWVICSHWATVF